MAIATSVALFRLLSTENDIAYGRNMLTLAISLPKVADTRYTLKAFAELEV